MDTTKIKKGLGRGLSSLIGETKKEIDINKISKEKGFVNTGDLMINLTSMPVEAKGMVNTLRVSAIE